MKKIWCIIFIAPLFSNSDEVNNYKFYAESGSYIAYLKKDDKCIYGGYMENNEIHRYCKFGSSDVDLDNQPDPSIYASDLFLSGPRLNFSISAY